MTVNQRFEQFLSKLLLTTDQFQDGSTKHRGVRLCLNRHYYSLSSETANSFLAGSWGKDTDIRPPRDIDVFFVLPSAVYWRYQQRSGNRQSDLLQEVKGVLRGSYPNTALGGDGQVVVVPFLSYPVEVVPAFDQNNGQYSICDSNNGGRYKTADPHAEINQIRASNDATKGNTRDLIRMMKRWQDWCNVPLASYLLEILAVTFLESWEYRGKSAVYYDYMVRDFFKYLIGRAGGYVVIPGTYQVVALGDAWKSRTESAYERAKKACDLEVSASSAETAGLVFTEALRSSEAGDEWQKIFGPDIPKG